MEDIFDKMRELHNQGTGFCFQFQAQEKPFYNICIRPQNKNAKEVHTHSFEISELERTIVNFITTENSDDDEDMSDEDLL